MAIAARIDSFVAPTITQQSLYDGIKQAFTNAGYPAPTSEFLSGTDRVVVYAVILDNTRIYGTTFIRIRVTTGLVVAQQIFATWNAGTNSGTGNSSELIYTAFASNVQINFVALNAASEFRLVMLFQGSIYFPLGFIAPQSRPAWWNLDAWNYCFLPVSSTFALLRGSTINPYSNTEHDTSLNIGRMVIANTITNRRDILQGVITYTQSNQGISGRSSDDLIMVAASGTTRFDIVQVPGSTNQYLILNPATGGLAVRVA
ncbi:hypothetical protein [Gloeocapsopsis dulcis]|nr:hypothetical protein [Gloeocapsopsis dulcis]WNN89705.1 hypothetical protein P0S91_00990 [Gloeocapsopsis dulcis]